MPVKTAVQQLQMRQQLNSILLALFFSINALSGQHAAAQDKVYSIAELKADIQFLKTRLENNHPGLYLYSAKSVIDHVFDSLENGISQPLTGREFYKHISIISSIIKDGHTILLPGGTNASQYLPYQFAIRDNQLFTQMVCTGDRTIPAGAEITSINQVAATDIIKQLCERQVRDGDNLTYPLWIISNYFRQYYSFIFGQPDSFAIRYKTEGQEKSTVVKALPRDSIYYYRQQHYPASILTSQVNKGLTLSLEKENRYAVLTIKDFHKDVLRKEYKQNFDKEISSFFEQIKNSKTDNLILDLRNNQGGDIENGVFLLSYLLDKPFSIVKEYYCVDDHELKPCKGPSLGLHDPQPNNYKGQLYVLINGGSFSNSGIVSSCLQVNKRATFIGQETGGNPHVINGFSKDISLPNSKIQLQIPTKQFVMTSKANNNGRGVMPTHFVEPRIIDVLENRDAELVYTIDLIGRDKKVK